MSDEDFYCVSDDFPDDEKAKLTPRRVPLEPMDAGEERFDPDTYVEGPNDDFNMWLDEQRGWS